jgi:hypothetical protein
VDRRLDSRGPVLEPLVLVLAVLVIDLGPEVMAGQLQEQVFEAWSVDAQIDQ